jgi:bifunctional DNA-binding transcriptional regulator/antitoxin component of YhaV-PrlF toxin-antitoxin module
MQNPETTASDNTLICEEDEEGNIVLTFPDELLDALEWGEGDELDVQIVGDGIVFRKVAAGKGATEGGDPVVESRLG